MRIISGKFGGRRILVPRNLPIRPTTDLAKESIFNILNNKVDLQNLKIIDLFSGSGSIGLEFISRGSQATFVESNKKCISHIANTLNKLDISAEIIKSDVLKYLNKNEKFDIVFADPPYKFSNEEYFHLIEKIVSRNLNENGFLILEHHKKKCFDMVNGFFECRNYGDCSFTFIKQKSG